MLQENETPNWEDHSLRGPVTAEMGPFYRAGTIVPPEAGNALRAL